MKLENSVKLQDDSTVIVSEMNVRATRSVAKLGLDLGWFDEESADPKRLIRDVLTHFDAIEQALKGCLRFEDEDKTFDDLPLSDGMAVITKFLEVNPTFLLLRPESSGPPT